MIGSYSSATRQELVMSKTENNAQALAELAAFAFSAGNIRLSRGKFSLILSSESEEIVVRMASLLRRLYREECLIKASEHTQPKKHTVYALEIRPGDAQGQFLFDIGLLAGSNEEYSFGEMDTAVFEEENFHACLRGAFLGCGLLTDPQKSYRLEFVLMREEFARFLSQTLSGLQISNGLARRRDRCVVYINQSESISDTLIMMGATNVMMELENIRVEKEVKNQLNRSGNCIIGNISKTVQAAQTQLMQIRCILDAGLPLSDALNEACELRLKYPQASLAELAQTSGISKSALNKRFIKIKEIYKGAVDDE